jgi:hypothetical protein
MGKASNEDSRQRQLMLRGKLSREPRAGSRE